MDWIPLRLFRSDMDLAMNRLRQVDSGGTPILQAWLSSSVSDELWLPASPEALFYIKNKSGATLWVWISYTKIWLWIKSGYCIELKSDAIVHGVDILLVLNAGKVHKKSLHLNNHWSALIPTEGSSKKLNKIKDLEISSNNRSFLLSSCNILYSIF